MKRDMDLAREILRQIDAHPDARGLARMVEERSPEEIAVHVYLLAQAGLVRDTSQRSCSKFDYRRLRLTWPGKDFLELARDDNAWRNAKAEAIEAGGELTLDVLKSALVTQRVQSRRRYYGPENGHEFTGGRGSVAGDVTRSDLTDQDFGAPAFEHGPEGGRAMSERAQKDGKLPGWLWLIAAVCWCFGIPYFPGQRPPRGGGRGRRR